MMTADRDLSLREELLNEILEDLRSLEGAALDKYLLELGFELDDLLASFNSAFQDPEILLKRRKFEAARRKPLVLPGSSVRDGSLFRSIEEARDLRCGQEAGRRDW